MATPNSSLFWSGFRGINNTVVSKYLRPTAVQGSTIKINPPPWNRTHVLGDELLEISVDQFCSSTRVNKYQVPVVCVFFTLN